MQIVGFTGKVHRSALVIDGALYDSDETYAERVTRLLESVNGDNIKVDVFTRRNGSLTTGTPEQNIEAPHPIGATAKEALKSVGYDLVITAG